METIEPEISSVKGERTKDDRRAEPSGLGGWLLLVAIGLVLIPFRMGWELYNSYLSVYLDGSLAAVTDPSSPTFVNLLGPLVAFEAVLNVFTIVWAIYAAYLFFSKNKSFPRNYQLLLACNLVILICDPFMVRFVMPDVEVFDAATVKTITQAFIGCAIWIPYMRISKRVKNTFIH